MPSSSSAPAWRATFLARLEHMTFAWFTSSMSLGGIADLLLARIIDSTPLFYVGTTLYLLNLVYILVLVSLQIARFTLTRASLGYTLSHPIECCFVPTALLACATAINGLSLILGDLPAPGWSVLLRVLFWGYFLCSLLMSLVCYTALFGHAEQSLHHMSPAWVLPIFPLMLCGSVAAVVVPTQPPGAAFVMAVAGLTCQGLGFGVSCMMYAVLLLRLMTEGWPPAKARPGLFMNCGPPAFTILCLLGLNSEAGRILPVSGTQMGPMAGEVLAVLATVTSIALWMISAWFYLLTLASLAPLLWDREQRRGMQFMLAWWASVFPITGFALATNELGVALGSAAVKGVAKAMVVWLLVVFVGVAAMHVRAVAVRGIMVEGKDEDRVIDTMLHRDAKGDVESGPAEKGAEQPQEEEEAHSPYSSPPTYPSTPAVSVRRLEMRKPEGQDEITAEDPSPSSSQLRMTPLASSSH